MVPPGTDSEIKTGCFKDFPIARPFSKRFKNEEIVSLCQLNLEMMKGLGQISLEKDW